MRCRRLLALALALIGPSPAALAGRIEWDYAAFVLPTVVRPAEPHILPVPLPPPQRVSGGVLFLPRSGQAVNSSHIILANLRSLTQALPGAAELFERERFELTLGVHDHQSGQSGYARFVGTIDGTLSMGASRLQFDFTDREETLHLGRHVYHVRLTTATPPGVPQGGLGAIGARVSVRENPEPGALLLAATGLPVLGWWFWRRRRT